MSTLTMKQALQHTSFPELAERASALYNEEEDALLLAMLGQEYVIRHSGITLRGQKAPENHEAIILDYLFSPGPALVMAPWRAIGDFTGNAPADFRKHIELPIAPHVEEFINRANTLMPLFDAAQTPSMISSDMAFMVRALPKVYLRLEMSRENQEFPAETWLLFSNNADAYLSVANLYLLAELFKDRFLSLLRIY